MNLLKSALVLGASQFLTVAAWAAPAELPPAGYGAPTYVDSTGCLFLSQGGVWVSGNSCGLIPSVPSARRAGATATVTAAPSARAHTVPQGYQAVWTDDRLNPHRGPRTQAGQTAMSRIWTNTVPMKRPTAGATPRTERKSSRKVSKKQPTKTPVFVPMGSAAPSGGATVTPVLSTKAIPAQGAGRFLQVGAFGVTANALAVEQRLSAAGLPVQVQSEQLDGRMLTVVLVGPVAGADAGALHQKVRGLGFADAFLR